jgi:type IV pilus assembly protein PilV
MKFNNGFTLIEVLIAVVILTGGILGMAALQATALQNNQSAYFRSQATQMAYDMSDRMRSNRAGVNATNYNDKASTNDDCVTNTCTPAQMAGYDLAQWNNALSTQLPGGVGVVCLDSTPSDGTGTANAGAKACDGLGSTYAIKIWWDDDRRDNSDNSNQLFVMSFQP